ncbi:MAG: N-acetylmuramoyl-L-alanine amidase [Elusimicrobia bacterium]|nr:N-acetylmuramoyl-L-alanine amidase [Elusimicrobiota bacterium]
MRAGTGRAAAAACLFAVFSLSSCDWGDQKQESPGQAGGDASVLVQTADRTSPEAVSKTVAAVNGAVAAASGDPSGDLMRPLFDGSRPQTGGLSLDASSVVAQSDPQRRAQALALINAKSRYAGLSSGSVPAPGTLPRASLPAADPSGGARGGGPVLAAFDAFARGVFGLADRVFSRRSWGAAAPRGSQSRMSPSRVTVHHTDGHPRTELAASIEEMRGYQSYHMNGHGWADIGYHFVVDGAGRVFEGRHADVLGAHAEGANLNNIGIAVMGDYNKVQLNGAQKDMLRHLISFLAIKYQTDPRQNGFIQGHMHFNNTDCPGAHIAAYLSELRRGVAGETLAMLQGDRPSGAAGSFTPMAVIN